MAVPFSNTRLRVPKGFQNVLEGLAREVLRCQPENIYSFAADYFEELLRKRQETGYDDITLLGSKLEDRFYNNHCFKNPNVNTNNEEQQSAAVIIQSEFRRHAAKKEVDSLKEEKAAIIIQASVRGHLERKILKSNSNVYFNGKDTLNQETISEDNQITKDESFIITEEENRVASQEKAPAEPSNENFEQIDIDLNDPDVEKAALKIQSVYKGFRVRKTVIEETIGVATHSIPHPNTEDLSLEKVTERDHTSDHEETAANEMGDDIEVMSQRGDSSLLIENNENLKESDDFTETEEVVDILHSELKVSFSPAQGANLELEQEPIEQVKVDIEVEVEVKNLEVGEKTDSQMVSEEKDEKFDDDTQAEEDKTENDINTNEGTEVNLDTDRMTQRSLQNDEFLETEGNTQRTLEEDEMEAGHIDHHINEEQEEENNSKLIENENAENVTDEIVTDRNAEVENIEEVLEHIEKHEEVTEHELKHEEENVIDKETSEENLEISETNNEEDVGDIDHDKSEIKEENVMHSPEMTEKLQDTTVTLDNDESNEEGVESQEVTLNETDAIDSEKVVDTTNDLEDTTIADHQEESNESVAHPDNEENQLESAVDEDGETYETSRTEATEGENN